MLRFFQAQTVPRSAGSSWLELFFDLVYVAILIELGSRLSSNLSLSGILEFVVLFVPVWWSWLALVLYTRYFPSDDIGQRLLTVLYMGAMILLAFQIYDVTGATAATFALVYSATKFILALMYTRAWFQFPEYRELTGHFAALYGLLGFSWLAIAFFAPSTPWLWGIVIAIDVLIPLIIRWSRMARGKPEAAHPPLKHHYMQHRFGELTIIVLGEFFIKIVAGSSGREPLPFNFFMGFCLLLISVSLWWLYFDHTDHVELNREDTYPGVWVYTHYFLLAAIAAYGVVGTKVFAATSGEILSQEKRLLLCIALAIAVLALGVIDWASPEKEGPFSRTSQFTVRLVSALILLLVATVGGAINVGWLVILVALVLLVQVGIDVGARMRNQGSAEVAAGQL